MRDSFMVMRYHMHLKISGEIETYISGTSQLKITTHVSV